jgi:hypothetical protein
MANWKKKKKKKKKNQQNIHPQLLIHMTLQEVLGH